MIQDVEIAQRTEWITKPIGEVLDVVTGNTPSKREAANTGDYMPFVKPPELQNELIGEAMESLSELGAKAARVVPAGSVLISCIGNLGRVGLTDRSIAFNQQINAVKPHPEFEPKYLFYYFQGPLFRNALEGASTATTVALVNKGNFIKLPLTYPPLPEQRRIVEAIELQLGRLDAAVARLHAAKAKLKRYRQAVLKAAVEGRLLYPEIEEGELPRGWKVVPVEAVGQIVTGNTPSKSVAAYYGDEHPFYKPTDLEAGYDTTESTDGLTAAGLAEARALPAKSILVTCIGATIGKTGFIRTPGACNQQVNAIVPNQQLMPEYGYFHCISPYFQKQIKDNASSTTLPLLNKSRFKVLDFILPTKSDQLRIVKEVEARLSAVYETDATLDAQLLQATRLRQAVLKRAFEGRLVEDTVNRNVSKG